MKCIHCNTDSTYPERQSRGGKCKQCLHPFAFDPRANSNYQLSDGLFQRAIKDVSEDGKLHFTELQLYYEICRRLDKRFTLQLSGGGAILAVVTGIAGIAGSLAVGSVLPFVLLSVPGVVGGFMLSRSRKRITTRTARLDLNGFYNTYVQRWQQIHGDIAKLVRVAVRPSDPSAHEVSSDVSAFSFDRALVTESADTAAMLVANNFHFENNCAILSLNGYPFDRRATVMEMLLRNPNLKVFAVHDASVAGCGMAQSLRAGDWFPDSTMQVIDLGLRPQHVLKSRLFVRDVRVSMVPAVLTGLTAEETTWLANGYAADLQQLRPSRLMRSLYQGFARANQAQESGIDGMGPGVIWIHDPVADVYASDSFG